MQPCSVPPLRVNRPDNHHSQPPAWAQAKEWFGRAESESTTLPHASGTPPHTPSHGFIYNVKSELPQSSVRKSWRGVLFLSARAELLLLSVSVAVGLGLGGDIEC